MLPLQPAHASSLALRFCCRRSIAAAAAAAAAAVAEVCLRPAAAIGRGRNSLVQLQPTARHNPGLRLLAMDARHIALRCTQLRTAPQSGKRCSSSPADPAPFPRCLVHAFLVPCSPITSPATLQGL